MSRRRSSKQDSLELLLDTICNTFGGVLFIAILVVLLLQQTGKAPASTQPVAAPLSELEFQTLTSRMEAITDELDRLRQNRNSQDAVVRSFAPEEVRQLLKTRNDVTTSQESLQSEIDRLLASNTGIASHVESLDVENADTQWQLDQSRGQLAAAQLKLELERKSRVSEVRMPVLRVSGHNHEIGLVLRYERLYVWHNYDSLGMRQGLNTDDFVVVADKGDQLIIHPNPIAGVVLDESPASAHAVRTVLGRFDPKSDYLAIIVRPNSYGVFRYVRDRAIELGFEYRLIPLDSDEPVSDRGGSGGRVQ